MKRTLYLIGPILLLAVSLVYGASEIRKLGSNDLEIGTGTATSPLGKVVTRINASSFPRADNTGSIEASLVALAAKDNAIDNSILSLQQYDNAVKAAFPGGKLPADNVFPMTGDNTYWEDLRFPSSGINPIGAASDAPRDTTTTGFPGTFVFSATDNQLIAGIAQLPHAWKEGSTLLPHIHWAKTAVAAGNVIWEFCYRIINRGAVPEAWVCDNTHTLVVGTDNAADGEMLSTFDNITMTGYPVSTSVAWMLWRRGANAADNAATTARLFDIDFHYEVNSPGSDNTYTKQN